MTKICTTCINCGVDFYRFKSYHNQAVLRGSEVKCCSVKCSGEARTKGLVICKPRRGKNLKCEICATAFYRPQSMIASGRARFCSEPCRITALKAKLIDNNRLFPERKNGAHITCVICSEMVYRKKSFIDRNINKTCGKRFCISAYSRSLWNLEPRDKDLVARPKSQRKYRVHNFTAKQRAEWIDTVCKFCGTALNLALDHILAVSRGGKNTADNAQTLCQPCNNWKAKTIDRP